MLAKHLNLSLLEVDNELPFADWWPGLVVALEAEERERRANYWGKAEDYVPFFAPEQADHILPVPGSLPAGRNVTPKILAFAQKIGAAAGVNSLEGAAKVRPDKVKEVYLDADGNVFDEQGNAIEVPVGSVVLDSDKQVIKTGQPETQEGRQIRGLADLLSLLGGEAPGATPQ